MDGVAGAFWVITEDSYLSPVCKCLSTDKENSRGLYTSLCPLHTHTSQKPSGFF